MTGADHPVRDHGREQGFDRGQHRDGEGGSDQIDHHSLGDHRNMWPGQRRVDQPEAAPDGVDRQMEKLHRYRPRQQRDERCRNPQTELGPHQ